MQGIQEKSDLNFQPAISYNKYISYSDFHYETMIGSRSLIRLNVAFEWSSYKGRSSGESKGRDTNISDSWTVCVWEMFSQIDSIYN